MWVDDQGVLHTVALPDPATLMSNDFGESLDQLLAECADEVTEMLELEETRFYEEHASGPAEDADEREFVGAPAPSMLITQPVANVGDLRSLLRGIDRRWRLDALTALDDYVS